MFALVIEREPPRWEDLPAALEAWLQNAGGFAAAGLAIWVVAYFLGRTGADRSDRPAWLRTVFTLCVVGAALCYAVAGGLALVGSSGPPGAPGSDAAQASSFDTAALSRRSMTVGGALALIAVALPFLADLGRLRWRRIWALARVSFKEAIRRKVLWVFSALVLVFLFASWFMPYKPEDQVRNYVHVIYWAMTPLLLVTGSLLAALSIPADVRSQTIHTIVTKPVERFEIVLGRFIGYTLLMSVVLVVMTSISLLYVLRELDPDASFESKRARVPIFGELTFEGDPHNVGYEWEYRRFIPGGPSSQHRAVWVFPDLPAELAHRKDKVPCEFSFEIFRTTKGEENKGIFCTFTVQSWHWDPAQAGKYAQERERERNRPGADPEAVDDQLAEKYGIYEIRSKEVVDYHTLSLTIPPGVFRNALQGIDQRPEDPLRKGSKVPALLIKVKCESPTQYLGVAKRDLYLLNQERSFEWNFFKGATGLWLRLCLVVGLAVACSTYLSGIIAWLTTMFLFVAGFFEEFIRTLAENRNVGGGPMESLVRLVNRENLVSPLDKTAGNVIAQGSDDVFRWGLRRFLDIIPDVEQFDFSLYVAEGFDIAEGRQLLLSLVLLFGYLLPWAILSYYLIKSREVAA